MGGFPLAPQVLFRLRGIGARLRINQQIDRLF